jgi:hypothetical protein
VNWSMGVMRYLLVGFARWRYRFPFTAMSAPSAVVSADSVQRRLGEGKPSDGKNRGQDECLHFLGNQCSRRPVWPLILDLDVACGEVGGRNLGAQRVELNAGRF